ncbi:hypothetical protein EHQ43_01445 [Leptospira bouyouniensis]|uniref:Uncharacterized protein n=1 Tax=Leptospira bouyouniensis TaxID=2484911 RepID=A0A7I0HWG3_9LEPT|nr:hypothetical protein [Leptospira bouyouniensis]TGL09149.1 hypothetical protein EHQ43_01445 [Leptospira bouyouniensis]
MRDKIEISKYLALVLVLLKCQTSWKEGKAPVILAQFQEFQPGLFYYVNENDSFLSPYQNEAYTVKRYMREKIHPVVKDFLNANLAGDIEKLSNYIGEATIEDFSRYCKQNQVMLPSKAEYRKLLFNDLKLRTYSCGISSYFGLYYLFNVKEKDVFFFDRRHYFLVWLYPRYKFRRDNKGSWESPPSFDELEHGSTFAVYYMKEPTDIVNRYLFEFHPDTKKYELFKYYPGFAENFVDRYRDVD